LNAQRRLGLVAVLAALAIGAVSAVIDVRSHDFVALYAAARLVLDGRGPAVLDPAAVLAAEHAAEPTRDVLLPFVHPPVVALALAPLAATGIVPAVIAMTALNVGCLAWSLTRLGRLAAAGQHTRLFALALFAPPALIALTQGQTSPAVLALVASAAGARPLGRGLALGLTLIRPQTFPLLALAALTDRTAALGLAAGAAIVVGGSAIVVGPDGLASYIATLVSATGWSTTGEQGVRTAIGWAGPALALGIGTAGLVASAVCALAGAVIVRRRRDTDAIARASLWSLLASPHVLLHDGLLAYPAVASASTTTRRALALALSGYAVALIHQAGLPIAPFWLLGLTLLGSERGWHGGPGFLRGGDRTTENEKT
jgi:hypothetical protein